MADHEPTPDDGIHPAHLALFLVGGLAVGIGLLTLTWSFGWPGGPLHTDFAAVGWTGLDNLQTLDPADYSIPLVVIGLACLVYANAIAWRHTGGY